MASYENSSFSTFSKSTFDDLDLNISINSNIAFVNCCVVGNL